MPNWEALYRAEVSAHCRTKLAAQRARNADRAYANRKYAELRAERDTIAAAYRALLDTLNKPTRQPRKTTVVDLSTMSDEQIRQYIIDNPGLVQVKG